MPAGWYPDPEQDQTQRYWDGAQWTDQRAPLAEPSRTTDRPNAYWACVVAVVAMGIGSVGPWVDAGFVSAGGLEGDGIIVLVAAAVALFALVASKSPSGGFGWLLTASLAAGATAIYDIGNIENQSGLAGAIASPGWGLILAAVGSLGLLVGAIALRRAH